MKRAASWFDICCEAMTFYTVVSKIGTFVLPNAPEHIIVYIICLFVCSLL